MTGTEQPAIASVRYMVNNVGFALEFYTAHLGFRTVLDGTPAFAHLQRGHLRLLLNGPASSAMQPTLVGRPKPGGWNRIQLVVDDVKASVTALRRAGHDPIGDVVVGRGGAQALFEDPSGNLVELFEPAPG